MTKGPNRMVLDQYLDSAADGWVRSAGRDWKKKADDLQTLAEGLQQAAAQAELRIGEQTLTGPALRKSMEESSVSLTTKADQLRAAGEALRQVGQQISDTKDLRDNMVDLGPKPSPYQAPANTTGIEPTDEEIAAQAAASAARQQERSSWQTAYEKQEARSLALTKQMDAAFLAAIPPMKEIHGEEDPTEPPPSAPSAPGGPYLPGTQAPPVTGGGAGGSGGSGADGFVRTGLVQVGNENNPTLITQPPTTHPGHHPGHHADHHSDDGAHVAADARADRGPVDVGRRHLAERHRLPVPRLGPLRADHVRRLRRRLGGGPRCGRSGGRCERDDRRRTPRRAPRGHRRQSRAPDRLDRSGRRPGRAVPCGHRRVAHHRRPQRRCRRQPHLTCGRRRLDGGSRRGRRSRCCHRCNRLVRRLALGRARSGRLGRARRGRLPCRRHGRRRRRCRVAEAARATATVAPTAIASSTTRTGSGTTTSRPGVLD